MQRAERRRRPKQGEKEDSQRLKSREEEWRARGKQRVTLGRWKHWASGGGGWEWVVMFWSVSRERSNGPRRGDYRRWWTPVDACGRLPRLPMTAAPGAGPLGAGVGRLPLQFAGAVQSSGPGTLLALKGTAVMGAQPANPRYLSATNRYLPGHSHQLPLLVRSGRVFLEGRGENARSGTGCTDASREPWDFF